MQMQIFDTMTQEYLQATEHWFAYVQSAGMHLMAILIVIQMSLKISKNIISGEGDAMRMTITAIKHLVILGILYYLMTNAGMLLPELFNSFSQLGIAGSTITSLDPSSVVGEGLSIASAIIKGFNSYGVFTDIAFALFGVFCAIAVVVCYGLIAADLMITIIESYFLIAVSSLFIAFGSTTYTLPMAKEYLSMTIGVGIKLMMLYVMIAVGVQLGHDWANIINQATSIKDWTSYLGVAVGAIIYYLIVKSVPARIASAASSAFAISHASDAVGTVFSGIANTATAATLGMTSLSMMKKGIMGGAGVTGNLSNRLHGNLSSFFDNSSSGLDQASSALGKSGLASNMLTHFGGGSSSSSGDSSIVSLGSINSSGGSSLPTPSVIYLPGPDVKGQSDLFDSNSTPS